MARLTSRHGEQKWNQVDWQAIGVVRKVPVLRSEEEGHLVLCVAPRNGPRPSKSSALEVANVFFCSKLVLPEQISDKRQECDHLTADFLWLVMLALISVVGLF